MQLSIIKKERNKFDTGRVKGSTFKKIRTRKAMLDQKTTGINKDTLSRFKRGKIDLYDYLFVKLEAYLTSSESQNQNDY